MEDLALLLLGTSLLCLLLIAAGSLFDPKDPS